MIRNILLMVFTLSQFMHGGDSNKVRTIECEPTVLYASTAKKSEKVEIVNIDGVQHFGIDLEKKRLVGKIGEAEVDIENIISRHGNENTFIFFGTHADSKFDWVLRIDKKTKKMILLAANADLVGFTVHGTCTWEAGK
jgi:hypothetical protein